MGLFNFFKKSGNAQQAVPPASPHRGPQYLRNNLTIPEPDVAAKYRIKYPHIQWAGQLTSLAQNRWFRIKYYGGLMGKTIIYTDGAVQKVVAVDVQSGEEILLFDKALHGWNAFICGDGINDLTLDRKADKTYVSGKNTDVFKIVFLAYYNNTRENLLDFINDNGLVEMHDGTALPLEDACDDAFDALVIFAIDEYGNRFEIIDEELR